MSQLQYYGANPADQIPHKNGLYAWGVVLIVCGGFAALMALLAIFGAIMMMSGLMPNSTRQGPALIFMGVGVYVLAAVVLIWLGLGSIWCRRWVRPLMIVGAVLTAVSGLASIVPMILGATAAMSASGSPTTPGITPGITPGTLGSPPGGTPALTPNVEAMILGCSGFFLLLFFEVLPGVLLWFYGRSSVQTTLDRLDPNPRWTDRCSLPMLGWSILCVLFGCGLCFSLFKGVYPFYMTVLVDMPGLLIPLALALTLCVGGVLCYRQSDVGLMLSFIAMLLLAGSYLTFTAVGDKKLLLDLMTRDMPAQVRDQTVRISGGMTITPTITYSLAVIYAAWLFTQKKVQPNRFTLSQADQAGPSLS
jgi:hypothetical protein